MNKLKEVGFTENVNYNGMTESFCYVADKDGYEAYLCLAFGSMYLVIRPVGWQDLYLDSLEDNENDT